MQGEEPRWFGAGDRYLSVKVPEEAAFLKREIALSLSHAIILLRSGLEGLLGYSGPKSCDVVDDENEQLQKTESGIFTKQNKTRSKPSH